ncbi:MAG: hypothetical protein ACRD1L_12475, partial [Terriglobales bacterium]
MSAPVHARRQRSAARSAPAPAAEAQQAAAWFGRALAELAPERLLAERLQGGSGLDRYRRIAVCAFGKAAGGMLAAWLDAAARSGAVGAAVECWLSVPASAPGPGAW